MKKDISNRKDMEILIELFYQKVLLDPVIGFIFKEIVSIKQEKHIPLIAYFGESILLDNPVYKNNAIEMHYDLNKKMPLEKNTF